MPAERVSLPPEAMAMLVPTPPASQVRLNEEDLQEIRKLPRLLQGRLDPGWAGDRELLQINSPDEWSELHEESDIELSQLIAEVGHSPYLSEKQAVAWYQQIEKFVTGKGQSLPKGVFSDQAVEQLRQWIAKRGPALKPLRFALRVDEGDERQPALYILHESHDRMEIAYTWIHLNQSPKIDWFRVDDYFRSKEDALWAWNRYSKSYTRAVLNGGPGTREPEGVPDKQPIIHGSGHSRSRGRTQRPQGGRQPQRPVRQAESGPAGRVESKEVGRLSEAFVYVHEALRRARTGTVDDLRSLYVQNRDYDIAWFQTWAQSNPEQGALLTTMIAEKPGSTFRRGGDSTWWAYEFEVLMPHPDGNRRHGQRVHLSVEDYPGIGFRLFASGIYENDPSPSRIALRKLMMEAGPFARVIEGAWDRTSQR